MHEFSSAPGLQTRSEILDQVHNKWAALVALGATAIAVIGGPLMNERPAYADSAQAVIGMPFNGKWAWDVGIDPPYTDANSSHPSVHAAYGFNWATDIYAPKDTEVKIFGSSPQGAVTFKRNGTTDTCSSYGPNIAGQGVTFDVLVNNGKIGEVKYDHIDPDNVGNDPVASGTKIGEVTSEPIHASCFQNRHTHVQFKNTQGNYSCYVDQGRAGESQINAGSALGVIGSTNANAKQACTQIPSGNSTPPPQPPPSFNLSFVRLNHSSGNVEVISYDEPRNFQTLVENTKSAYPAVPPDGNVVPLFKPNGDISFVRLNHSSGNVEVVTYTESSGYKTPAEIRLTAYPRVAGDGSVVPTFMPNGDISFIRLNHSSGKVEVISYSASSGYQQIIGNNLTAYPAVSPDGSVIPLYKPNGDLAFLRMNHSSGKVELIAYSRSSGYQQLVDYQLTSYPAVTPRTGVVPMFQPDGDLSFVRLNHSSGNVEIITYSSSSSFHQLVDYDMSSYPAVAADGGVVALYSK